MSNPVPAIDPPPPNTHTPPQIVTKIQIMSCNVSEKDIVIFLQPIIPAIETKQDVYKHCHVTIPSCKHDKNTGMPYEKRIKHN